MNVAPFNISVDEKPDKTIVSFSGQLIINHASKITELLKDKLNTNLDLEMVINNPDNLDVTVIQLIYSIKNSFLDKNKKVNIIGKLKAELETLVNNSGFKL